MDDAEMRKERREGGSSHGGEGGCRQRSEGNHEDRHGAMSLGKREQLACLILLSRRMWKCFQSFPRSPSVQRESHYGLSGCASQLFDE